MAVPFHGAAVGLLVAAHVCSAHGANATPSANATSRRLAFVGKTVLPDLWFIGASKCATTTLAYALTTHPQLAYLRGEGHIFDGQPAGAPAARVETLQARIRDGRHRAGARPLGLRPDAIVMEYTPHYLFESSRVPARICAACRAAGGACAAARFLVILRDPVDRTVSSWKFKTAAGVERRPLRGAVADGAERARAMARCVREHGEARSVAACPTEALLASGRERGPKRGLSCAHVGKSLYVYQLRAWWATIPRERFRVELMEQYLASPAPRLAAILSWAGLAPLGASELARAASIHALSTEVGASVAAQDTPAVRAQLRGIFEAPNRQLDRLLGFCTGYSSCTSGNSSAATIPAATTRGSPTRKPD